MQRIRKLFLDEGNIKTNLLCLIAIFLPFQISLGNVALIIAFTYNLLFFKRLNFRKTTSLVFIFPFCIFLIALISAILSKDITSGLAKMDRHFMMIMLCAIFMNHSIDRKVANKILTVFYHVMVWATAFLLLNFLVRWAGGTAVNDLVFHGFTNVFDQHPVYYSLYLSVALFYGLRLRSSSAGKDYNGYLQLFILSCGLALSASKGILLVVVISFLIWIGYSISKGHKGRNFILVLLTLFIIVGTGPFIKERFINGLKFSSEIAEFKPTNDFLKKKVFTYEEKEAISDIELRYLLGSIGLYHLIKDGKFWFGYGQGDAQDYLDYYFYSYSLGPNWYENFNVHNQYLHILIYYGIFAMIFFLTYLIYSLRAALGNRDLLYLLFLITICIVFAFEVPLVRNKGIIFFYFFNTLFLLKNDSFENRNIGYKRYSELSRWI